jgi:cycloeucalenol cycloisomerase
MIDTVSHRAGAPASEYQRLQQRADEASSRPRWFSENPSKSWGEKFFLAYSPIWMTIMGLIMALGIQDRAGEWGFLAIGLVVALPLVLVPALIRDESYLGRRWYETYWFKANVYIAIFNFAANYFGSEYFFDVLGMVYNYPAIETFNFDSALVGTGEQRVPVMMYLLTQAYFMTYHTTAIVVLRRLRTSGLTGIKVLWPLVVLAVAYFWAWMETRLMANPIIEHQFYYREMGRMLAYGSMFYATYFVASFPIFYHLDETRTSNWSLTKTAGAACAAGLIMLVLLDFATRLFGPI